MYFLGIDIGSTAVKATLIQIDGDGATGRVISRGAAPYPTSRQSHGRVTQKPADWAFAVGTAARTAVSALPDGHRVNVNGISLSSQGGSIFAADAGGEPLCDAMSWMDRRAVDEAAEISSAHSLGTRRIADASGWAPSPSGCGSKLLWLRRNEPDIFASAAYFYTTAEYITCVLTGNAVSDPTSAVITRMYDYKNRRYIPEILDYIGISADMLPPVLPSGSLGGHLTADGAALLGLEPGVPVYIGAHDQYCASIGSGVTETGHLLIATGTAWVVFGVSDRPIGSDTFRPSPCRHPAPGRYGIMCSLSEVGGALGRFADTCGTTPAELDRLILSDFASTRRAAADLLVCPTPSTSPLPHREGVCGDVRITPPHTAAETALAAMEGAAFEARALIERFESIGFPRGGGLVMSGGAAKSAVWRSVLAAVMAGRRVSVCREPDAPALGAALIAAVASGALPSLTSATDAGLISLLPVTYDGGVAADYAEKYARYREWAFL